MPRICINAGHKVGMDPGVCGSHSTEAEQVLKYANIAADYLRKVGYQVLVLQENELYDICDKATYKLYSEGRTIGTFQFESPGMQKYLRELQPTTFEDLIAMNALYRPGPMDYIPDFIDRKQGRKPIEYDIPIIGIR